MISLMIIENEIKKLHCRYTGQLFLHIAMCYGCVMCADVKYKGI